MNLHIETLWESTGFQPNDDQIKAVLYGDGPLYLTAGPGSGEEAEREAVLMLLSKSNAGISIHQTQMIPLHWRYCRYGL